MDKEIPVVPWIFGEHCPSRKALWLPGNCEVFPKSCWILLHGAGGSAEWAIEESCLPSVARRENSWLFVPEGRSLDPDKPSGFLQNPKIWDDGSDRFREFLGPGDDLSFFDALVNRIREEAGIRGCAKDFPIHLIGFSNGGAMAARLVRSMPGIWSSATFICSLPPPGCPSANGSKAWEIPVLTIHGNRDPLIPWDGGSAKSPWLKVPDFRPPVWEEYAKWFASNNPNNIQFREHSGLQSRVLFHKQKNKAWLESWLVEEMGHHWPGGLGRINRRMAGPPSWRLDANDLIADFTNRTVSEQNNPDQILDFTNPSRWQPIPSRHPIAKA